MHCNKARQSSFRVCDCISHSSFDRLCVVVVGDKAIFFFFFFYICSICIKSLYEHEQTSKEDMPNTSCYRPTVAIMVLAKLSGRKTNTATSCISLHF